MQRQNVWRRLAKSKNGSVAIQFALAVLPIAGLMGMGIDYTRATHVRADLQASLDAAVLAAVRNGNADDWKETATQVFAGNAPAAFSTATPTFTQQGDGTVVGSLAVVVPTELVGILGIRSIDVSVRAVAAGIENVDDSCILSLDKGGAKTHDAITLNGAPNIQLDECTLRSNTSLRCNGHTGGAIASIAVGTASGCSNPQEGAKEVPDIFASLAEKIEMKCGASVAGATWTPGKVPGTAITVVKSGYTEYHICGTLTVSGTGYLTGGAPASDSVIIIENGSLIVDDKSTISTARTAIVLTGNNSYSSSIEFPNGKGKASVLALSPPVSLGNPWRGIALYQDPALTKGVDHDWGPAVTFNPDGVVYLPNSNVTISGSSASNLTGCTKVVTNTFRTNGSVDLKYRQSAKACADLGVTQWSEAEPYLSM